jgi:hypothetical protein
VLDPLNAELNPICHLLALLGAHPTLHVSRLRVKAPSWLKIKLHHFVFHAMGGEWSALDGKLADLGSFQMLGGDIPNTCAWN